MRGPGRPRCPTDAVLGEMLAQPRPHRQDWCGHLQIAPVVFGRLSEQRAMGKAQPSPLLPRDPFVVCSGEKDSALFLLMAWKACSAESCQGRERAFLGCCSAP